MTLPPVAGLIIFIAGLAFIIIAAPKMRINLGILAIAVAFLVGRFVAGVNASTVIGYWNSRIMIIFMLAGGFFGYVKRTGMFETIGDQVLWTFRKTPNLIPFALFFASFAVSALGAGGYATPAIVSPIAFEMATLLGFNPMLAALATFGGCFSAGNFPYQSGVVTFGEFLVEYVGEDARIPGLMINFAILGILYFVDFIIQYFITGAYKIRVEEIKNLREPKPLTKEQKGSLAVIVAFIILAAGPGIVNMFASNPVTTWISSHFEIYTLFVLGMLVMNARNVADPMEVLKNDIPWSAILMVCGVGMYVGLITPLGCIDLLASWIAVVPAWLVFPLLFLFGGFLAAFANGLVVVQALLPIYSAALAAFPQLSPMGGLLALWCGQGLSSGSPFSTGGAMSMVGCTDDSVREGVVRRLFVNWILVLVMGSALALIGLFNLF